MKQTIALHSFCASPLHINIIKNNIAWVMSDTRGGSSSGKTKAKSSRRKLVSVFEDYNFPKLKKVAKEHFSLTPSKFKKKDDLIAKLVEECKIRGYDTSKLQSIICGVRVVPEQEQIIATQNCMIKDMMEFQKNQAKAARECFLNREINEILTTELCRKKYSLIVITTKSGHRKILNAVN